MYSKNQIAPVVSFRNSQGELVRGTITNLQRKSLVMEIYNPYSIVQVSEILKDLTVKAGTFDVYRGKAVVVSMVSTGLTAVVSVSLPAEWRELSMLNGEARAFGYEARVFVRDWDDRFKVGGAYQVAVNGLRAFLSEVSRWVEQVDMATELPRLGDTGRLRDDVFYELADPLINRAQKYLRDVEEESREIAIDLTAAHRAYAQAALHPLLLRSPFIHRTYTKPLGYAGDYEMVNQILGDLRQGPNTYFQIVNVAFLRAQVAEAHRNRIDVLVDYLKRLATKARIEGRQLTVINVGCGPAIEIQRFLSEFDAPHFLRFELIDFSVDTLDYTRRAIDAAAIKAGADLQVTYTHNSVNELIKRRVHSEMPSPCDAIYCAGLFDYLSDKVCTRLLEYFVSRTNSGGSVLVTNVHVSNPDRLFTMEHLLEWYLIYRDETHLAALFPFERSRATRAYLDATGVNAFVEATVI